MLNKHVFKWSATTRVKIWQPWTLRLFFCFCFLFHFLLGNTEQKQREVASIFFLSYRKTIYKFLDLFPCYNIQECFFIAHFLLPYHIHAAFNIMLCVHLSYLYVFLSKPYVWILSEIIMSYRRYKGSTWNMFINYIISFILWHGNNNIIRMEIGWKRILKTFSPCSIVTCVLYINVVDNDLFQLFSTTLTVEQIWFAERIIFKRVDGNFSFEIFNGFEERNTLHLNIRNNLPGEVKY